MKPPVLVTVAMALGCHSHGSPAVVAPAAAQAPPTLAASTTALPASTARPETGAWGFDLAGMDRSVRPGADFYQYANGRWLAAATIPEDRSTYSVRSVLADRTAQHVRDIIETASGPPGSDAQRLGDYYRAYLDEAAIEAAGLAPLQPELDRIAAIRDRRGVMLEFAASVRRLDSMPFRVWVVVDDHTPDRYLPILFQGGLGLPDRDMYDASAKQFAPQRDAYRKYIATMFDLLGWTDADRRAAAVYALEEQIARAHWSSLESRDPQKTYHLLTPAALQKLAPSVDWTPWLSSVGLAGQGSIDVTQPSAIAALAQLVAREPVAVWRDYLTLQRLTASAEYLPKRFGDAHFEMFYKAMYGSPQPKQRSRRAVEDVIEKLGEAVGRIYVAKYFTPQTRMAVAALVDNVQRALRHRIDRVSWMSAQTKAEAQAKLAALITVLGAPDTWRDYSTLTVVPGDAVGNAQRAREFEYARLLGKIGPAGQTEDWPEWLTPMSIDALAAHHTLIFAAAQLQPPYFDPAADAAVNYGAIGALIGHEFSHNFDDRGAQHDATGALRNWWTPDDARQFKAAGEKLAAQYDAYCPIPARGGKPAQCVNGARTLSENIADLVGVTVAYDAYEESLGGHPAAVIDGFTGEQRFFLGYAQSWREHLREPLLAARLVEDDHSPGQYRVNTVRNVDAWYDAFHPSPGDALYLPPDQRVRIW